MPILKHKGEDVVYIDGIPCIVRSIHSDWVSVDVINENDFTLSRAFVARIEQGDVVTVAHGSTLKTAFAAAHDKYMSNLSVEERVDAFVELFAEKDKKYPAKDFFIWHGTVTGSCLFGRERFVKEKGINLDIDELTVKEFIDLTIHEYGSEAIQNLAGRYGYA